MRKEIKSKRKPYEKHFINKDGTFECDIYQERVHYFSNGSYEEIDNTLIENGNIIQNKKNDLKVKFSKEINQKLFSINYQKNNFEMLLENGNKVKGEKNKNKIKYKEIFNNIDLEYIVLSNKVKEQIIIKNKNGIKKQIVFNLKTDLKLKKENEELILFNKEKVFKIEKPFMIDNNNNYNNNIYYNFIKIKNGYKIILNLDINWLEKATFPVIIDPTIVVDETNLLDTYIKSNSPSECFNTSENLKVSKNQNEERTLIKFNLPVIGTGSNVIDAKLSLVVEDYECEDKAKISMHRINTPWNPNTATWNNMNDKYDEKIEDYCTYYKLYYPSDELITTDLNITNLVKKWYSGLENYGVMLKVYGNNFNISYFSNDNAISSELKPVIAITYRNQNGLESYMTYQRIELENGALYANNYNGNITTTFSLGNTLNSKLPASLNLYYNTNDVILNKDYGFGIGNRLNFNQTIRKLTIEDEIVYEYTDEDGTIHYFNEKIEESISKGYFDEDGLSLKLIVNNDNCIIKDKDSNQMYFEKNSDEYRLTKIVAFENNEINIIYQDNKIIKIKDSDNEEINIDYEENITITSPSKTTNIILNNNNLTKIIDNIGEININYTNNLINTITTLSGKKIELEYYNVNPYRIKKIKEKGRENTLGKTLTFDYDFEATIITDEKGTIQTNTFNSVGNTETKTIVDNNESYGKNCYYGNSNQTKNKLIFEEDMMKFIDNYIYNSSFEKDNLLFSGNISFTNEYKRTGLRSLKIEGNAILNQNVNESNYYTFSLYSISNSPFIVKLNNKQITINNSSEFIRSEITNYCEAGIVAIEIESNACLYIDDIQLEKGKVANSYNLIDNANFRYGLSGFTYGTEEVDYNINVTLCDNDEIVTSNGKRYFKRNMGLTSAPSFSKKIITNGEIGDTYFLSFWYKNSGLNYGIDYKSTQIYTQLIPTDANTPSGLIFGIPLNKNDKEWQFYSRYIVAEYPYQEIDISMIDMENVNEICITDFTLVKSSNTNLYKYNSNGNLISYFDENNNETTFKYDNNNQLIKMTEPKGNDLSYEYDKNIKSRILSGISKNGITNEIKYDEFGNPIKTVISNKIVSEPTNGVYYLRLKGTNKYLKINPVNKKLILEENDCSHEKFTVTIGEKITLKPLFYDDYYTNNLENLANLQYEFINQDNKSIILKSNNKYLTYNNEFILSEIEDFDNQQIYFEKIDSFFIENDATYTNDGKYLTSTTDTLLNKTQYQTNYKGLITSITDSLGNVTNYTYNNKEQLIKIQKQDMEINYTYFCDLISKITQANKEYSITYDEFLNVKTININNNNLITHNYEENNGNLYESIYGNGSKINYEYDNFNRISKIIKGNNQYNIYYDNFNNLKKIESNNIIYNYSYDLSQRLIDYIQNDFRINYQYTENNLLKTKKQNNYTYNYEYNLENNLEKIIHDNVIINYAYDELNRLKNKTINNYVTNYEYLNKGNRTSTVIKKIINNNHTYNYEYDKLGNITKVYKNNNLINTYKYDQYSQLIEEIKGNQKKTYQYDCFGNILNKKTYQNDILIDTSVYSYENDNWQDQLTKFNNEIITYDAIGNPLTIGNTNLTWSSGRELVNLSKDDLNVSYKYNKDGIRVEKQINNDVYKYKLEGNKIIFRQKENNVLYFIYEVDNVIGFIYNNQTYYYNKNLQNDIISIRNSDNEIIVNYEYDSWENILSIKDNNNNDITNQTHIAYINPFRYRSYYYDNESGLYYLNTRYYNPKWRRFINIDELLTTDKGFTKNNMYCYAGNNPVSRIEIDGCLWFQVAGALAGGIIGFATKVVSNVVSGEKWDNGVKGAIAGGAVTGLLMTTPLGLSSSLTTSYAGALAESVVNQAVDGDGISWETTIKDTLVDGTGDYLLGKTYKNIYTINKGWYRPKKFKTSFTGSYIKKLRTNMIQDSVLSEAVNGNYVVDTAKNNIKSITESESTKKPTASEEELGKKFMREAVKITKKLIKKLFGINIPFKNM